ncbi:ABC transporter substrate-binding protein [Arthrobacter sp. MMS24-T111]
MKTSLRTSTMVKSLAAAATLALLATGCSPSSSGDSGGNVTVRFTWWGNDLRNKETQQVIDAFQASHPNIKIQAEPGVWSSYWDKLATTTAANDSPDVIQMDQAYIAEYGGRGALLDLSKQSNIDTSKIDQDALNSGQVSGKQFGLSTGQNAKAVMINAKMFQDYGVPIPDDKTWTWADYTKTAAQIAKAAAKAGQTNYGSSYSLTDSDLNTWAMQHGESLYSADGGLGFKESTATSFFQNLLDMRNAGACPAGQHRHRGHQRTGGTDALRHRQDCNVVVVDQPGQRASVGTEDRRQDPACTQFHRQREGQRNVLQTVHVLVRVFAQQASQGSCRGGQLHAQQPGLGKDHPDRARLPHEFRSPDGHRPAADSGGQVRGCVPERHQA